MYRHPHTLPKFSPVWELQPNGWWAYIGDEKKRVRPPVPEWKPSPYGWRIYIGEEKETVRPQVSEGKPSPNGSRTYIGEKEKLLPPVSEEEEVWPPVWKSVEKSPQYHYIGKYFQLGVDDIADVYPPGSEDHDLIKRFLQEVRESRGYDVDCNPRGINSPFYSWPIESVLNDEEMYAFMEAHMKFVIGKINAQAEKHGENCVLYKLEKVVGMSRYRTYLLTFTVKEVIPNPNVVKTVQAMVFHAGNAGFELQDWRFKP